MASAARAMIQPVPTTSSPVSPSPVSRSATPVLTRGERRPRGALFSRGGAAGFNRCLLCGVTARGALAQAAHLRTHGDLMRDRVPGHYVANADCYGPDTPDTIPSRDLGLRLRFGVVHERELRALTDYQAGDLYAWMGDTVAAHMVIPTTLADADDLGGVIGRGEATRAQIERLLPYKQALAVLEWYGWPLDP